MASRNQFRASEFIAAIPGTGGIISTIASRVGCDWHTAKKYIEQYPTVQRAYGDEVEKVADIAESMVIKAIRDEDIGTAKWYLSRKAAGRGYAPKLEQDIEQAGEIILRVVYDDGIDDNASETSSEAE